VPTKKKNQSNQGLTYKDKPLVRQGDVLYYGHPDKQFIIVMRIQEKIKVKDLEVSSRVSIELQKNDPSLKGKERIVKKAERDGLYKALDIASFWLDDALSS